MKYKDLFFDLDGTITDSGEAIMTCAKYALDRTGFPDEPEKMLRRFIGPSLMDSFERLYGMDREQAEKACELYRSLYLTDKMYDVTLYTGIEELLAACGKAGLRSYVVTSKVEDSARKIIERMGLSRYFRDVIGPDPADFSSDKSRLINRAAQTYRLEKSECIMIGDTRFDIEGAVKAGVDSIAVTWGYGDPAEVAAAHPTYTAADTDEVRDILMP